MDELYDVATEHTLPKTSFYSVEYPGYVEPRSESVARAMNNLGGPSRVEAAFRSSMRINPSHPNSNTSSKPEPLIPLELHLRPDDFFAHPIPADMVHTGKLVLKVTTRRKRRRDDQMDLDHHQTPPIQPEFKAEVIGSTWLTARFRSMADFQYQPDRDDRITKVRQQMETMDAHALQNFTLAPEREDYAIYDESAPSTPSADPSPSASGLKKSIEIGDIDHPRAASESAGADLPLETGSVAPRQPRSNLRLFPPPIFSRQAVPQLYNYKANPSSTVQTVTDGATGGEKLRTVNKSSYRGVSLVIISVGDVQVPEKPHEAVEAKIDEMDGPILTKLKELTAERPVWSRAALMHQFNPHNQREFSRNRYLIPSQFYAFRDGPFWGLLVRIGYDPRKQPESRKYQRLWLRDRDRKVQRRPAVESRLEKFTASSSADLDEDFGDTYIFDGKTLPDPTLTTSYQVCDVTDTVAKEILEDTQYFRDTFDDRDGWYIPSGLDLAKALIKYKLLLLKPSPQNPTPRVLPDDEARKWVEEEGATHYMRLEGGTKAPSTSHMSVGVLGTEGRKRNRAKKETSEVDRQAARLRAAIERDEASGSGHVATAETSPSIDGDEMED